MSTADKLASYVLPTYAQFAVAPVRGQGTILWDGQGTRYLDFCSGLATCTLGHGDTPLSRAITRQAAELIHCSNLYQIDKQAELAGILVEECLHLPGRVFFSNSGAESNDGLIKLARRFGHAHPDSEGRARYEVITFRQSFHGRTIGGIAATGQDKVKEGFDPLLPGFRHLDLNELDSLASAIRPETCAILLEAIQGEGGILPATPEFLQGVSALCKEHDLLFMLDEIQCGLGRAGNMAGWRSITSEPVPDAVSWAKGMGGGFPIGGFWIPNAPPRTEILPSSVSWAPDPTVPPTVEIPSPVPLPLLSFAKSSIETCLSAPASTNKSFAQKSPPGITRPSPRCAAPDCFSGSASGQTP